MSSKPVWDMRSRIEQDRQEFLDQHMIPYDQEVYRPALETLYDFCRDQTGHNFRFSHRDINNNPHYKCLYCGLIELKK